MNEDELLDLQRFTYRKSRIPALDALATFVPAGQETDPVLQEAVGFSGFSRWFPVPGGHRLLVLYERGSYATTASHSRRERGIMSTARGAVPRSHR